MGFVPEGVECNLLITRILAMLMESSDMHPHQHNSTHMHTNTNPIHKVSQSAPKLRLHMCLIHRHRHVTGARTQTHIMGIVFGRKWDKDGQIPLQQMM